MRLLLAMMAAIVGFGVLPVASDAPASAQEAGGEEVIVILDEGEDPVAVAAELGVELTHVYEEVFTGFAGTLPADAVTDAASARSVQRIFLDGPVQAEAQTIPTGVRRAGVPTENGTNRLAVDSPVDADIAILDTGVTRRNDLRVAGGKDCVDPKKKKKKKKKKGKKGNNDKKSKKEKRRQRRERRRTKPWEDDNGHGTHIAGIAAAIDNDSGVVGVAPGARIWAVKVLDAGGGGTFGDVICGLDWVVKRQATIDVVNLSLSGAGSDGPCSNTPFHQAICNVVNAGIPVVVAAGNQGTSAGARVPAAYDEVITVSGLADSDGAPGKDGPTTCSGYGDDTFLPFSNDGPDVDIMAPGDCILSLSNRGEPVRESGTSAASPHVAGAAAHFIAQELAATGERPTPQQTQMWLETEASRSQAVDGVTGDDDGNPEPVLWLEVLDEP